jgi:hypothetical protein
MAGNSDDEVFPPTALDDVRDAMTFLRASYPVDAITLGGICSGAYHAFQAAAAGMPVNAILLVNPSDFFLSKDMIFRENRLAERAYVSSIPSDRIFLFRAIRKVITGQLDAWEVLRTHFKWILSSATMLRDLARRLGFRLRHDLGLQLRGITSGGVEVIFVFARGEPGLDLLNYLAGSTLAGLADKCRVHVINGGDHVFTQSTARDEVEDILSTELFSIK